MRRVLAAALAAMLLTGCASLAEPQLRTALADAGLSRKNADCMAGRMVDRLSLGQIRKLEALKPPKDGKRSLSDYVETVRRVGDPELIGVTTSSAALCTTGLAR
ncbi:MAG: hypothetical protein R3D89_10685 [Sphingomonadaceae bacterium]